MNCWSKAANSSASKGMSIVCRLCADRIMALLIMTELCPSSAGAISSAPLRMAIGEVGDDYVVTPLAVMPVVDHFTVTRHLVKALLRLSQLLDR